MVNLSDLQKSVINSPKINDGCLNTGFTLSVSATIRGQGL